MAVALKLSFPLNDSKIAMPSFNVRLRYSARVCRCAYNYKAFRFYLPTFSVLILVSIYGELS